MSITKTVRAQIEPEEIKFGWKISTIDVQNYIQKKLNLAAAAKRKELAAQDKDDSFVRDIKVVAVSSIVPTKKFHSFLIILDINAAQGKKNMNELSIFNEDGGKSEVRLKDYVYFALKDFQYQKADKASMTDPKYRKKHGNMRTQDANRLASVMTPKTAKIGNDRKVVQLLLDPIRVFWDMCTDTQTKEVPDLVIKKIRKLNQLNFEYTVREFFEDEEDDELCQGHDTNGPDVIAKALQYSLEHNQRI